MALVFKIKHMEDLRRWVVSPSVPEITSPFPVKVKELEAKVRELFHVAADKVVIITYVDKEGDVVTLADDQDLWDACMVQSLNPLRLDVQIDDIKQNTIAISAAKQGCSSIDSMPDKNPNLTSSLSSPCVDDEANRSSKPAFPQVTSDMIKQFLNKYSQTIDPNLQPAVILRNIHKALKDFVKTVVHEGQRLAPKVGSPGRSPAFTRCASEPPFRWPSMDSTMHPGVHVGVTCDECNCSPIRGVRYKSIKVFNYDLCSDCFAKIGNETDYHKIDKPVSFQHPAFYHTSWSEWSKGLRRWPSPFASGTDGWKAECPFIRQKWGCLPTDASKELDASFVKDSTVFNGGELIPGMAFQWIIRLKNNGSKPWPQGTKFIYLSGTKLAAKSEVDLKIPASGLPVGVDVEIRMDMRAPDMAGNYVSHWCLAAPSGERFGKTLWVALHVVSNHRESSESSPEVHSARGEEDDGKSGAEQQGSDVARTMKPVAPLPVDMEMAGKREKQEGRHGGGGDEEEKAEKEDSGPPSVKLHGETPQLPKPDMVDEEKTDLSDEVDGFSMVEKPSDEAGSLRRMMRAPVPSSLLTLPLPTQEQYARISAKETEAQDMKLRLLESMGFSNHDLNTVLLKKNKQDLQLTLDDLLLGSGWDNLLKDLQEMGFTDTHTNLRLLIKNEGSLKRVVKELIELEKYKVE